MVECYNIVRQNLSADAKKKQSRQYETRIVENQYKVVQQNEATVKNEAAERNEAEQLDFNDWMIVAEELMLPTTPYNYCNTD